MSNLLRLLHLTSMLLLGGLKGLVQRIRFSVLIQDFTRHSSSGFWELEQKKAYLQYAFLVLISGFHTIIVLCNVGINADFLFSLASVVIYSDKAVCLLLFVKWTGVYTGAEFPSDKNVLECLAFSPSNFLLTPIKLLTTIQHTDKCTSSPHKQEHTRQLHICWLPTLDNMPYSEYSDP